MKKTIALALMLVALLQLASCKDKPTGNPYSTPDDPIVSTRSPNTTHNKVPDQDVAEVYNINVNGFPDAKSFIRTQDLGLNTIYSRESPAYEYFRYFYATTIRNPWFENNQAPRERTLKVGDKVFELKYERSIVSNTIIADEYLIEENKNIKIRYYPGTNLLAEIVGINEEVISQMIYMQLVPIDDLVYFDVDYNNEQAMFEYARKLADAFDVNYDGLIPTSSTLINLGFAPYNDPNSQCYEFFTTADKSNYAYRDSEQYKYVPEQRCVSFNKVYDNGIGIPVFKLFYGVSDEDGKGLFRIQFTPQVPDEVFDCPIETLYEQYPALKDKNYTVVHQEYEIVCNNVITLNIQFGGTVNGHAFYKIIKVYPDEAKFPEIPWGINIPYYSCFPDGVYHSPQGDRDYGARLQTGLNTNEKTKEPK